MKIKSIFAALLFVVVAFSFSVNSFGNTNTDEKPNTMEDLLIHMADDTLLQIEAVEIQIKMNSLAKEAMSAVEALVKAETEKFKAQFFIDNSDNPDKIKQAEKIVKTAEIAIAEIEKIQANIQVEMEELLVEAEALVARNKTS